ncbi:MAG: hypothetical protein JO353_04865 [Phycisphaerae bacterium]|nr:hypothetical protein [Phycisphaerae bacterium]
MNADFRWNDWNRDHVTQHGVSIDEAEAAVRQASAPWPAYIGDGKYRVYGAGTGGRIVHVIFLKDEDGTLFIIHARAVISKGEKRRVRRRRK